MTAQYRGCYADSDFSPTPIPYPRTPFDESTTEEALLTSTTYVNISHHTYLLEGRVFVGIDGDVIEAPGVHEVTLLPVKGRLTLQEGGAVDVHVGVTRGHRDGCASCA